jgi:hypothetical protein
LSTNQTYPHFSADAPATGSLSSPGLRHFLRSAERPLLCRDALLCTMRGHTVREGRTASSKLLVVSRLRQLHDSRDLTCRAAFWTRINAIRTTLNGPFKMGEMFFLGKFCSLPRAVLRLNWRAPHFGQARQPPPLLSYFETVAADKNKGEAERFPSWNREKEYQIGSSTKVHSFPMR